MAVDYLGHALIGEFCYQTARSTPEGIHESQVRSLCVWFLALHRKSDGMNDEASRHFLFCLAFIGLDDSQIDESFHQHRLLKMAWRRSDPSATLHLS